MSTSSASPSVSGGRMGWNPKGRRLALTVKASMTFFAERRQSKQSVAVYTNRSGEGRNSRNYCPTDFRRPSRLGKKVCAGRSLGGQPIRAFRGGVELNFLRKRHCCDLVHRDIQSPRD